LRNTYPHFWSIRVNDEGVGRENSFHRLVSAGKIELVAPNRAVGYTEVESPETLLVNLGDGRSIEARAVVLATGYKSSWNKLFDGKRNSIGF
jgi:dimethylaniline monooxygenase (N-oxide forming)